MQTKITIKGMDELIKNFKKYPAISAKEVQAAINKSILYVEGKAKIKTPVKTGRLRAGYRQKFGPLTGTLFNPIKYAMRQHEGISFKHKVGEAKFMEKALDESIGRIEKFFGESLDKILKRIAK